ncbi:hypothetical protein BH20ACT2_BH20ACT2_08640 [soil metagenome]
MTIEDRLRTFINEELRTDGVTERLADDYALLEHKIIDSLGIFQIVSFLETEFDVEVDDEELLPDNFGTIGAIARLVSAKRS